MSKLTLNTVGSLIDSTTAQGTINTNNGRIVTAVQNTLSLDGTAPNQMQSQLDMNSNQIINLPAAATANSPLRLQDLNTFIGGGTITSIPSGGTTGQPLGKRSNTNYDVGYLTSPVLGTATATSINKIALTTPATGSTLTIPDGVTFTGPAASGTAMTVGNAEIVTGVKTFGVTGNVGKLAVAGTTSGSTVVNATAVASGTLTLPAATDTLVGKATTDVLTNKTLTTPVINGTITGTTVIPIANGGTNDTGTAWASYTPTVTSGTGTLTTTSAVGHFRTIGKTVFFTAVGTITTNGTGASNIQLSLPVTVGPNAFSLIGNESAITGKLVTGSVNAGGGVVVCTFYDGTYPGGNGTAVRVSGVYESV